MSLPLKWIVSGDIGPFKIGQELTTKAEIGQYFRIGLSEGEEEVTAEQLSDDAIMAKLIELFPQGYNWGGSDVVNISADEEVETVYPALQALCVAKKAA